MCVSWEGPDSRDRAAYEYPVNFQCKPAPAEIINSLESGRLLPEVDLGDGVRFISARMINNEKRENLGKVEATCEMKYKTLLSARLVQDQQRPGRWAGELSILSSWMEGGTRTYDGTGTSSPKSEKNLYTVGKTYALESGNSCTAGFCSEDAFHWQARSKSTA